MHDGERWSVRVAKQYFNFGSAHFLVFGDGAREELHGHNYRVAVEASGPLRPGGMVLDFIMLKPIVKDICDRLDHRTLLATDCEWTEIVRREREVEVRYRDERFVFPTRDVVELPIDNVSVEYLARWISGELVKGLHAAQPDTELHTLTVEVEETPGQSASYHRDFR